RTEMKNMNSLKAIRRAIEYEVNRHIDALETGFEELVQETRRWDDGKNQSFSMRNKEDATDYRYFPNAELMPIVIDGEWINRVLENMPEPANSKYARYMSDYGLPEQDCRALTSAKALADAFDGTVQCGSPPKEAANWILVELINLAKSDGVNTDDVRVDSEKLAKLIGMVDEKTVNRTVAKEIFAEIYRNGTDPAEYAEKHKLGMVSDEGMLLVAAKQAIAENPGPASEYREGNKKALGFFMGLVMRKTGGKADPAVANGILKKLLDQNDA
ncbi:MAG: Asp-tRNA(Asn)/Glu-tRNA(Gln) amidotransferase GatCAB subunit B, partial [Clostridiales bacterium]|nr:Asp-tRNA(Asn)/Glu-tRNA(Gln) amidotransferase GatCAB subunit B [Clostridiales bacterium]